MMMRLPNVRIACNGIVGIVSTSIRVSLLILTPPKHGHWAIEDLMGIRNDGSRQETQDYGYVTKQPWYS
jgi:hypothetical protein